MKSTAIPAAGKQQKSVRWVVAIAAMALIFDGYVLVVYGAVVPILLNDPTQLGAMGAAEAGALGSAALLGVMVGALVAGGVGDYVGRRRVMLTGIVLFSVGMAMTAMAPGVMVFGGLRFFTGLGVGALVATAGAMVAEFAPKGRRNFYNAIVYSGVPAGGVLASLLAMVLTDAIGWRGLFWIGALPLLFLFPMALMKLPESPKWLLSRGRVTEAKAVSIKTGIPLTSTESTAPAGSAPKVERAGFAALASKRYLFPTLLLGMMSFSGLLLTYGLNTWLPEIMSMYGYGSTYSLAFLLVLNGGAIVGGLIASISADRLDPRKVVASTFVLAALALVLLTLQLPFTILLSLVAIAGVGTIGTQVLIYGFVSNYYETYARAAGVAWCAGFGRLGGVFGPLVGGFLIAAGVQNQAAFYVFAGVAVFGALITLVVPRHRNIQEAPAEETEPALAAASAVGS